MDPIGFAAGSSQLYTYAAGEPVQGRDATGLCRTFADIERCYSENNFAATVRNLLGGGEVAQEVAEAVGDLSALNVLADLYATALKWEGLKKVPSLASRTKSDASGINLVTRRAADFLERYLPPRVTRWIRRLRIGDLASRPLSALGGFVSGYDTSILLQCILGIGVGAP